MPGDGVELRTGDKALRFIIERKIFCRNGHAVYDRLDNTGPQKPRKGIIDCRDLVSEIHRITGKNFVAAVAAESERYMLPHKARQQICRNQRAVRQRFVKPSTDI